MDKSNNKTVYKALLLDFLPTKGFVHLEITDGIPTFGQNLTSLTQFTLNGLGEYGHCVLIKNANGLLEFTPLGYRPSPYPQRDMNIVHMQHPDGKTWAIVDESGPSQVFFANTQTNGRLVYQQLKDAITVSARVIEKQNKGYVLVKTTKYISKTRSIQI